MRQTRLLLVRIAPHGKVGDVLLQRERDGRIEHAGQGALAGEVGVVEGVADVEAVQGGGDGEEVGVGAVGVGFVEVVGVAGEDELGDEGGGAVEVVGVALRLGAVEDGRVEGRGDVFEDLGEGADGGDDGGDLGFDVGAVFAVGWGEVEALLVC